MGARSKVRSGSQTLIVAITNDYPKGIPLGLVENFSITQPHRSEALVGVGAMSPEEVVHHGTSAVTVSWGTVETIPEENYQKLKILPEHRRLAFHEPIDLLAQDLERGELKYKLTDCLPENFTINIGSQASLRNNVSMMAKHVEFVGELN